MITDRRFGSGGEGSSSFPSAGVVVAAATAVCEDSGQLSLPLWAASSAADGAVIGRGG